jgi:hypothetical protein
MELRHQMANCSWKPNNRMVAIVLFTFSFKTGIHFTGLMLFQQMEKRSVSLHFTSLESNCFGFSSMVLMALRLNLHVDAEMMNVGIKQAWCYQMYHPD